MLASHHEIKSGDEAKNAAEEPDADAIRLVVLWQLTIKWRHHDSCCCADRLSAKAVVAMMLPSHLGENSAREYTPTEKREAHTRTCTAAHTRDNINPHRRNLSELVVCLCPRVETRHLSLSIVNILRKS